MGILEKQLIVKVLVFIKVRYLPKTRMKAMNDRVISVPIPDDNIAKRVNKLPRNENNSGIVTVRLKRRMKMKNYHNIGIINTDRVYDCLDYLVKNHPAYKDIKIENKEDWLKRFNSSPDNDENFQKNNANKESSDNGEDDDKKWE